MSKRVLFVLGIGFLVIIVGIFLLKYELSGSELTQEPDEVEPEPEEFEEEELKLVKTSKRGTIKEETPIGTEADATK